jgi:antitoxin component of MazEF toxin-antitoxin module
MKRKVRKQGSSLVVGLTPAALEILKLKEGDFVDLSLKNGQIVLTKAKEHKKK